MRAVIGLGGLMMLAACGGGGTTGTNYSEAPPVAEIVATPSPRASETPTNAAPAPESAENAAGNAL
ncbi:MAG: hypothetical protein EOP61_03865 [Sphingomonadales bacterium]|nr:MAG: hypothetical protein EOP61_03865 [Sphingomonadales bacterium]